MVVGLLAWLAWDVETDITVASQRGGLEGLEDQQWYAVQLLASLSPWLVDDDAAWNILEESVARTPRFRIDGERWIAVHRAALETFALVALTPDEHRQTARRASACGGRRSTRTRTSRARAALDWPPKVRHSGLGSPPDAHVAERAFNGAGTCSPPSTMSATT
jgi:hypothetical protein